MVKFAEWMYMAAATLPTAGRGRNLPEEAFDGIA